MTRGLVVCWLTVQTVSAVAWAASDENGSQRSALHPAVVLRDGDGQPVVKSGHPVSTLRTCGECHDTDYITRHSYHVSLGLDERTTPGDVPGERAWDYTPGGVGRWNPLMYRYLSPPGDPILDLGVAGWIERRGWRHVGSGLAEHGFADSNEPPASGVDPDNQVLDPATGKPRTWDWDESGRVEMNCFLCHCDQPDNAARIEQLEAGHFAWADTATLRKTGIVEPTGDGWHYRQEAFQTDGSVDAKKLGIREPAARHCGQCHGMTHEGQQPLTLDLSVRQWSTATKGQVFAGQRISDSGANIQDKAALARPWDVHAEALIDCRSCHFSLNNPARVESSPRNRPAHLRFEPRRLPFGDYLRQPSHQFAKGQTAQGTIAQHLAGTMRRCEDCHDAVATHAWLPYAAVHFDRLSCEACHIPATYAPAVRQVDWTMIDMAGGPQIAWRGIEALPGAESLVTGFRPVLLPRENLDGKKRLVPFNLVTSWYWVSGGDVPRPVRQIDLQHAFLANGQYHPELVAALDTNGDGKLQGVELRLDSQGKTAVAARRLAAVGVVEPRIVGEIQPYGVHHGVGPAAWATQSCEVCHAHASRLSEPMALASYVPGGVRPTPVGDADVELSGTLQNGASRGLEFVPDTRRAKLYVLGHNRWAWINLFGLLGVVAVIAGAGIHGALRVRHGAWRLENKQPVKGDSKP